MNIVVKMGSIVNFFLLNKIKPNKDNEVVLLEIFYFFTILFYFQFFLMLKNNKSLRIKILRSVVNSTGVSAAPDVPSHAYNIILKLCIFTLYTKNIQKHKR